MADAELGTVLKDEFEYGGMCWSLLGKQIGRHMGMTDRELVAFGTELAKMVDDRFDVPKEERFMFSIEFVDRLAAAIEKTVGKHRH